MFFLFLLLLVSYSSATANYKWVGFYSGTECTADTQLLVDAYLWDGKECVNTDTISCRSYQGISVAWETICPVVTPPRGEKNFNVLVEVYDNDQCTGIPKSIKSQRTGFCDKTNSKLYWCNATTGLIQHRTQPRCTGLSEPFANYQHGVCSKTAFGYSLHFCNRGFIQQGMASTAPVVTSSATSIMTSMCIFLVVVVMMV